MEYADEYYLKIKINKISKKLHFPSLSKLGNKGERIWTNDLEGEEVYLDRITLEDLIKYHEIEYDCKTGVMFNEGYNNKIGQVIRYIYDLRMKYKKEGNPVQLLYKLILNTAYGKTIQKPRDSEIQWRVTKNTTIEKICGIYGGSIEEIHTIDNRLFKIKTRIGIIDHWAMPQCGSLVLSESKRIMAEAMVSVDDNIVYTDTDSMFIDEKGYERLKREKPYLFGNDLGQFKIEKHLEGDNVYIEEAMFFAPKLYYTEEVNEKEEKYVKITMKGIPQKSIDYVLEQKFGGDVKKLFYAFIKRKVGVYFDLLNGGDSVRMEFSPGCGVLNLDIFSRTIGGYS